MKMLKLGSLIVCFTFSVSVRGMKLNPTEEKMDDYNDDTNKLLDNNKPDHNSKTGGYGGKYRAVLVDCKLSNDGMGKDETWLSMNHVVDRLNELPNYHPNVKFNIVRLSDHEMEAQNAEKVALPTPKNIKQTLKDNLAMMNSGDTFIFAYSGHGDVKSQHDFSLGLGYTPRGILCCITEGEAKGEPLWDYELQSILCAAKPGVKIIVLLDACKSGYTTVMPFRFRTPDDSWINFKATSKYNGNIGRMHRYQKQYNAWMKHTDWYRTDRVSNNPPEETADKPFIISLASSEYDELSCGDGKTGMDAFLPRMLSYMFGDFKKTRKHEYFNLYKSVAQQYYMSLDSARLEHFRMHPVLTSNCTFDPQTFSFWDFLTQDFKQNGREISLACKTTMESCRLKGDWSTFLAQDAAETSFSCDPKSWQPRTNAQVPIASSDANGPAPCDPNGPPPIPLGA